MIDHLLKSARLVDLVFFAMQSTVEMGSRVSQKYLFGRGLACCAHQGVKVVLEAKFADVQQYYQDFIDNSASTASPRQRSSWFCEFFPPLEI